MRINSVAIYKIDNKIKEIALVSQKKFVTDVSSKLSKYTAVAGIPGNVYYNKYFSSGKQEYIKKKVAFVMACWNYGHNHKIGWIDTGKRHYLEPNYWLSSVALGIRRKNTRAGRYLARLFSDEIKTAIAVGLQNKAASKNSKGISSSGGSFAASHFNQLEKLAKSYMSNVAIGLKGQLKKNVKLMTYNDAHLVESKNGKRFVSGLAQKSIVGFVAERNIDQESFLIYEEQ